VDIKSVVNKMQMCTVLQSVIVVSLLLLLLLASASPHENIVKERGRAGTH